MAYDTSTANPVNPQGTVGGGNVQNISPLFGNNYAAGNSSGNNPATTTNKDTAALGGAATRADAVPTTAAAAVAAGSTFTAQLSAFWTANKPAILMIAAVGALVALVYKLRK